jgi:hypothetical protein
VTTGPNPYAPPSSPLDTPQETPPGVKRPGWAWKLYLFAGLFMYGIALVISAYGFLLVQVADVASYVLGSAALVGLFGYCYGKSILSPRTWRIFLPVLVLFDLLAVSVLEPRGLVWAVPGEEAAATSLSWSIFSYVLNLPLYLALYRYGFKRSA